MKPSARPSRMHTLAIVLRATAVALGTWWAAAPVLAGPWEARTAQGLTVRIVQDVFRTREGYVLERVYPDGSADGGFGEQGSLAFTMGPDNEGPAALRVDAIGRPWVAGASAGRGDRLQAVVLRFLPSGPPDVSYAEGGRSATAPAGRAARALDLVPQPDGSSFVVGLVSDGQGHERAGWWRLGPDGRVDTRFGSGGLWLDDGEGSTEVMELAAGGDGSVALSLRRGEGSAARFESWLLAAGALQPQPGEAITAGSPQTLQWREGRWRWTRGGSPEPRAAAAAGAQAPGRAAAASPGLAQAVELQAWQAMPAPPAAASAHPDAQHHPKDLSWAAWLVAASVALGGWWLARQLKRKKR